jgi:hypothetical protein
MTSTSSSDRVVLIRPAKLAPSARNAEQLYKATWGSCTTWPRR